MSEGVKNEGWPSRKDDVSEEQRAANVIFSTPANAMQVGGAHYRSEYQHWDFVRELQLSYLQGCASKYISRWRKKNGLEDLRKALHYIAKAAENTTSPDSAKLYWGPSSFGTGAIFRFSLANELTTLETWAIHAVVVGAWEEATGLVKRLIAETCPVEAATMPEVRERIGEEMQD